MDRGTKDDASGKTFGGIYDSNYCAFPSIQGEENEELDELLRRVVVGLEKHKDLF